MHSPDGGLIVGPATTTAERQTILELAALHRLPTVSETRGFAVEGSLIAYGTNNVDRWRRASSYVDRILRGAKVSELAIEYPTKFRLIVNVKTANAMGLTVPESFLVRADELIE